MQKGEVRDAAAEDDKDFCGTSASLNEARERLPCSDAQGESGSTLGEAVRFADEH